MSGVDVSNYDTIVNALEKRYKGTISRGHELDTPDRIPTGSLDLDWITGGGIPMGRWTRIYGGESSGKTRTCWDIIREAQNLGMSCCYYNVEKQYDPVTVARTGVNIEDLTVVDGSTIEEVGEKMEAFLGVAHLHVVDSCSNAVSIDELEADLTAWRPGLMARAWGKVLRRAHERFDPNENSVILIDQLRTKFGPGKSSEEPPGGKFLKFLSSMSLNFRKGKWLFYDKNDYLSENGVSKKTMSGDMEPDGREIKVRCEKSRVGRPDLVATLHFDHRNYDFDRDFEYIKTMKHFDMVTRRGSWWQYEGENVQGDKGLREVLEENDLYQEIYDRLIATNSQAV